MIPDSLCIFHHNWPHLNTSSQDASFHANSTSSFPFDSLDSPKDVRSWQRTENINIRWKKLKKKNSHFYTRIKSDGQTLTHESLARITGKGQVVLVTSSVRTWAVRGGPGPHGPLTSNKYMIEKNFHKKGSMWGQISLRRFQSSEETFRSSIGIFFSTRHKHYLKNSFGCFALRISTHTYLGGR